MVARLNINLSRGEYAIEYEIYQIVWTMQKNKTFIF